MAILERSYPTDGLDTLSISVVEQSPPGEGAVVDVVLLASPSAALLVRLECPALPDAGGGADSTLVDLGAGRGEVRVRYRPSEAVLSTGVPASLRLGVPPGLRILSLENPRGSVSLRAVPCERVSLFAARGDVSVSQASGFLVSSTGRGDVRLNGFDGDAVLTTGAGLIAAEHCSGRLRLHTGEGDMVLTDFEGGLLSLHSRRGSISVKRANAEFLRLSSGEGSARLCALSSSALHAELERGDCLLVARLAPGEHSIAAKHGQVTVELADPCSLRFDLATGAGSIQSALSGVQVGRRGRPSARGRRLVGSSGAGDVRLTVDVGRGDVVLRRAPDDGTAAA